MKTEFQGKYYNGVSSKPYPCTIRLEGHSFVITTLDEFENSIEVIHWILEQISKNDIEISTKIRLKYSSFPYQTIEVEDKEFSSSLSKIYPYSSFAKKDIVAILSRKWKFIVGFFLLLLAFGIFSFRVIIPNLAEYAATKVPLYAEQTIGESAYNQISTFSSEDTTKSRLVQEFFDEMNLECTYNYQITVLNSETVNAFAVPGGRIAVYSGILDQLDKPEELAALLAHESSHVELQHSLKSIFRSLSGYFVISLLFGDAGGVTAVVFENIYVFQDLQYSREMEKEADIRGLECMQKANINPNGMIGLFKALEKISPEIVEKHNITEFMSTHPQTKNRIKYMQEYINKVPKQYQNNSKLDSLFKEIEKIK